MHEPTRQNIQDVIHDDSPDVVLLKRAAAMILLLNGIDAILTVTWIQIGSATEANPVLASLAHTSPVGFVAVKILLVSLGVTLCVRHLERNSAAIAILFCAAVYSAICIYHFAFMSAMLI